MSTPSKESDKKCAIGKKWENGSCLSLDKLKKISNNDNIKYKSKPNYKPINITDEKESLVEQLNKRLKECSDQICWTRLNIIKEIDEDRSIRDGTFLPKGPSDKYEWLSTNHIDQVIAQAQEIHNDFVFLGAVPYDFEELSGLEVYNIDFEEYQKNHKKNKFGMVINLDTHNKKGSHWVALYFDLKKNQIYFFDSVGKRPGSRIRKFINKIIKYMYFKLYKEKLIINDVIKNRDSGNLRDSKQYKNLEAIDVRFNQNQHQFKDSECGVYSIYFILELLNDRSFQELSVSIVKDEEMNRFRSKYFRNYE